MIGASGRDSLAIMVNDPLIIGIDLSTTAAKAIAWDPAGRALAEGRAPLTLGQPVPGAYEQEPEEWGKAVETALAAVLRAVAAERVAAVAVANQRETVAVFDAAGRPLRPALLWLDERRKRVAGPMRDRIGADRLHGITGKPPDWAPAGVSPPPVARAAPRPVRPVARGPP